jgi:dCTP deaminase
MRALHDPKVTLGEWYYRNSVKLDVINPWCEAHVREYWGAPRKAAAARCQAEADSLGVAPGQRFIVVAPGETILAHTNEFVGGRRCVTTMMKCRSSLGRSSIGVCKCAGWGDVGYINRWTLEVTNFSTTTSVLLPVGHRIAQIVFLYCGVPLREYHGKYQDSAVVADAAAAAAALTATGDTRAIVAKLEASWTPEAMLPKLWLDYEKTGAPK